MFTCYLGHPWCNAHVKPLTEADFRKAEELFKSIDKAFAEGGPAKALQTAKRLLDESV